MTKMPAALAAAVSADKTAPTEDRLEQVRKVLREVRDLERTIADQEETLKANKAKVLDFKQRKLVDLFQEVGIDTLGLPPEGNLPGYDAELKPYYHANISTDWEPERQLKAFDWLDDNKSGDLIRSTFTVFIGKDDRKTALKVQKALDKLKVPYETKLAVPWNTLTAWLKEQVEKHKTTPPLDLLGATVGSVVNLKARKADK